MGYFENWFFAVAALVSLAIFLYSTFDLLRRLLSRFVLHVCQLRKAPEGGFLCAVKRRLQGYAEPSLVPRMLMSMGSLGLLMVILTQHSSKL